MGVVANSACDSCWHVVLLTSLVWTTGVDQSAQKVTIRECTVEISWLHNMNLIPQFGTI